jgi:hypothetical protein
VVPHYPPNFASKIPHPVQVAPPISGSPLRQLQPISAIQPSQPKETPIDVYRRLYDILKVIRENPTPAPNLLEEFDRGCDKITTMTGVCQPESVDHKARFWITFGNLQLSFQLNFTFLIEKIYLDFG